GSRAEYVASKALVVAIRPEGDEWRNPGNAVIVRSPNIPIVVNVKRIDFVVRQPRTVVDDFCYRTGKRVDEYDTAPKGSNGHQPIRYPTATYHHTCPQVFLFGYHNFLHDEVFTAG